MTLIGNIYLGLAVVSLVLYLLRYVNTKAIFIRYIIAYLLLIVSISVASVVVMRIPGVVSNLFVYHFFTIVEYVILANLFKQHIRSPLINKLISVSVVVVPVLGVLMTALVQPITENNSYTIMIESALIIFIILFFLKETIELQEVESLQGYSMFWISIGLLFYFAGNLFIEGTLNYLIQNSMELARKVYRAGFIFKYFLFILLIIALYSSSIFRSKSL